MKINKADLIGLQINAAELLWAYENESDARLGGAYAPSLSRVVKAQREAGGECRKCNPDWTLKLRSGAVVKLDTTGLDDASLYPASVVAEFDALAAVVLPDGSVIA